MPTEYMSLYNMRSIKLASIGQTTGFVDELSLYVVSTSKVFGYYYCFFWKGIIQDVQLITCYVSRETNSHETIAVTPFYSCPLSLSLCHSEASKDTPVPAT